MVAVGTESLKACDVEKDTIRGAPFEPYPAGHGAMELCEPFVPCLDFYISTCIFN